MRAQGSRNPNRKIVSYNLDKEMVDFIREMGIKKDMNDSYIVRHIIQGYINRYGKKNKDQ